MNMNLINENLNKLYESIDTNKLNEIKKLLSTQKIKHNTFFEDYSINSNSISEYPESLEELFKQLNTISRIDYISENDAFLKSLEQLFFLIENEDFNDEIPIFTYTL